VEFRAAAVETLDGGVPEEDVVVIQDGAVCNRDVVVPEEEVVEKQVGAGCNRAYGGSEEYEVGKQNGAVRIRSRWPQRCQPCGLVEENGGTPFQCLK